MTAKEDIEAIDDVLSSEYHYDETLGYQLTSDDFEWLENAKSALEKQIPKKPVIGKNQTIFGIICGKCSECGAKVYSTTNRFCHKCGQAIDWSEDENV